MNRDEPEGACGPFIAASLPAGASRENESLQEAYTAYLYLGGAAPNATADLTLAGAASDDFFGVSVASAGDANGDGYGDFIIGAPWVNANSGAAYLYFGGATLNASADLTPTGEAEGDQFGFSVD